MKKNIDSIKHPLVVQARALLSAAGRRDSKKCLLLGEDQIRLAVSSGAKIETIFYSKEAQDLKSLKGWEDLGIPCFLTAIGVLKKISETSYLVPVIAIASIVANKAKSSDFAILLDRVVDHGNVGTIIRTARAFGIKDFYTTQDTDFFYKKIIDASRGLVFDTNFFIYSDVKEAINKVRKNNYFIVATSPRGEKIQSMVDLPKQPIMLVLGNETEGVSEEVLHQADLIVQIPMPIEVESLNVGVFAGISMYELKLKQVLAMLKEKIRSSLGRDLGVTTHLMRSVLDAELKKVSDLSSSQVILLMMVSTDKVTPRDTAMREMGVYGDSFDDIVTPLVEEGYLIDEDVALEISDKGENAVAKLWPVYEKTEDLLRDGISEEDQENLKKMLKKMQKNAVSILRNRK